MTKGEVSDLLLLSLQWFCVFMSKYVIISKINSYDRGK